MGSYRLSEDAQADLIRIHQYGVRRFGEAQADQYYSAFFDRFEQIAEQPYLYQSVDEIREG
jgi:toxin ParE1/3/4